MAVGRASGAGAGLAAGSGHIAEAVATQPLVSLSRLLPRWHGPAHVGGGHRDLSDGRHAGMVAVTNGETPSGCRRAN